MILVNMILKTPFGKWSWKTSEQRNVLRCYTRCHWLSYIS